MIMTCQLAIIFVMFRGKEGNWDLEKEERKRNTHPLAVRGVLDIAGSIAELRLVVVGDGCVDGGGVAGGEKHLCEWKVWRDGRVWGFWIWILDVVWCGAKKRIGNGE
jgi:hypothetical protein